MAWNIHCLNTCSWMSGIEVFSESRSQDLGKDLFHAFLIASGIANHTWPSSSLIHHSSLCLPLHTCPQLCVCFWALSILLRTSVILDYGPTLPSYALLLTKALFLNKISSWSSKKQMKEGGTSNLVHSPYSCLRVQMRQQLVAPERGSRWDQGHSFMARYQSYPITSLALHSVKQDWWEHIFQEVGIIKAILEAGYMLHLKKYTQPHQTLPRWSPASTSGLGKHKALLFIWRVSCGPTVSSNKTLNERCRSYTLAFIYIVFPWQSPEFYLWLEAIYSF